VVRALQKQPGLLAGDGSHLEKIKVSMDDPLMCKGHGRADWKDRRV